MRRHALGLLDHLIGGVFECRATDGHGARSVCPPAKWNVIGIALNQADALEVDAEPFRDHLGIHSLVALSVIVGAGDDGHAAALVEMERHAVIERRADFDEVSMADST